MTGVRFLPKGKLECYSPRGIRKLFDDAIRHEGDDIEKIFKKSKHKKLIELWHASFLALAIRKHYKKQYCLCPGESPDVHFLDKSKVNTQGQEGFTVEVTELFSFEDRNFDGNYKGLADKIWGSKGNMRYEECELLLVSRLSVRDFNVSSFAKAMNVFLWYFRRIWLGVFREQQKDWTFFEIFPHDNTLPIQDISFSFREDKNLLY